MIGYLNGTVKFFSGEDCILDVNGVGYRISVDSATRQNLKIGKSAELFIHTAVRDDAINLYGFQNQSAFELFEMLLTVSGIGAKSALGIVAKISAEEFAKIIAEQNLNALTNLPGIGKKSAQRILLELKDKLKGLKISQATSPTNFVEEATEALEAFGYTQAEISAVLNKAPQNSTTEQLIKFALKELNRFA